MASLPNAFHNLPSNANFPEILAITALNTLDNWFSRSTSNALSVSPITEKRKPQLQLFDLSQPHGLVSQLESICISASGLTLRSTGRNLCDSASSTTAPLRLCRLAPTLGVTMPPEIRITNRVIVRPIIPLGLLLVLLFAVCWRGLPTFPSTRTIEVILISNWHIEAEKQQLLRYKPGSPNLPEYQPLPGAPANMNVYHFGCSGCMHIFEVSDPNKALQYYWSELTATDRSDLLTRLGYQSNAEFTQLLHGPFPKTSWAYQHGYLSPAPNLPLNADAASSRQRPNHRHGVGSAG